MACCYDEPFKQLNYVEIKRENTIQFVNHNICRLCLTKRGNRAYRRGTKSFPEEICFIC
jgi:hypothetical protein